MLVNDHSLYLDLALNCFRSTQGFV